DLNAVKTLAEITRLRQAACHPALVKPGYEGESSKSAVFMELLQELMENNHRALVFSQFTSHLAFIKKELERHKIEYLYLDGATPTQHRSKLVKSFQTGNQPVFLISLKAGGLGLNLTAADYIIHLDPWWNPAIEDQASDRAYRIGQTRPVTVYRLIARHTIEEKIIELHRTKKDLADSLLEGSNLSHKLSREEMLELLRRS
ncbi:MAG: C-terminal helicase domain-containing protein, partial [Bacteroidales bacterium]